MVKLGNQLSQELEQDRNPDKLDIMYKYCNSLLPSSFDNTFKSNSENHDYNTRNALNFEYPINKLNFCDKSICYQVVKTWNNIPNYV